MVPPGADEAHRAHDSLDECRLAEARVCVAEAGGSAIEPDAATEEEEEIAAPSPAAAATRQDKTEEEEAADERKGSATRQQKAKEPPGGKQNQVTSEDKKKTAELHSAGSVLPRQTPSSAIENQTISNFELIGGWGTGGKGQGQGESESEEGSTKQMWNSK